MCNQRRGEWKNYNILMLALKKSQSSPQIANLLSDGFPHSAKPQKRYLQQLSNEVNKSRIAIENMSHTKALDGGLYKRVQQLQKQLHHCILSINHESSKKSALDNLITLLKGQMSQVQAVQKNEEEFQCNNFYKKIKKVQYDIKQILHKYNQEIAKINSLKEWANASRDERVVYSNLFNKIQKEIKHYEQIYKQTLIKNQIFIDKKRDKSKSNKGNQPSFDSFDQTIEVFAKQSHPVVVQRIPTMSDEQTKIRDIQTRQNKKSIKISDPETFLTNIKESKPKQQQIRHNQINSTRVKNTTVNQSIENMIKQKEGDIDRIIATAQCRDMQQVIDHYGSLEQQNVALVTEVQEVDQKIAELQQEIDKLKKQKRTSEIYQNGQLNEVVNIGKKSRSNKYLIEEIKVPEEKIMQQLFYNICTIMKVDYRERALNDQLLRQVDLQIQKLGCRHFEKKRKESKLMSVQQMSGVDRGVCELLQKIDKFGESQKIYDRNMLKAQYQRELSKVRKKGKKGN